MSAEANIALVRTLFAGLDRGDVGVVDQLYAPAGLIHFPGSPGPLDREGIKVVWGMFLAAFPGIQHTIEDVFTEGDRVALRMTVRGTHLGDFQGMPPTGKEVTLTSSNIFRLAGGKIVESWAEFDALGMLQQLGAVPAPSPA
jgi:ketosteroid isomerase-like protein